MASEAVLKELFQVSKASSSFKGISDEDIWKACLSYKDRSDDDIRTAMANIQKKDQEAGDKSDEQQKRIEDNKEKMIALHHQEEIEHEKEERDAEKVLEDLFNS